MTTYNKISEQIQRLYARQFQDKEDLTPALHEQEVRLLVNQVANELISAEPKQAQRVGDISIPSSIIATYTGQTVDSSLTITSEYATATALVADQGAQTSGLYYWVVNASDLDSTVLGGYAYKYNGVANGLISDYTKTYVEFSVTLPFFPMQLPMDIGVWSVVPEPQNSAFIPVTSSHWELIQSLDEGLLEGSAGYYVEGRKLIFTTNPRVSTVKVKLLINDITTIDGNSPFPLPPQMEAILIREVLQILTGIPRGPNGQTELVPDKPKG